MRAIICAFLFVAAIAMGWAFRTPLSAIADVNAFARNRGDLHEAEEELIRGGAGALTYLQNGLHSKNRDEQFHCAKVLLVLGDDTGETFLLNELRTHSSLSDGTGREAEAYLLAAWDRRDGPSDAYRKRLREIEHTANRPIETIQVMNECLTRFPNWADGYARRARIYQRAGEAFEAKRDALAALACAPNHFEAMVTLGKVQLSVEAPYHAFKCFERAILVNPRLKNALKDDIQEALKAIDADKEKRREEKRRNATLV